MGIRSSTSSSDAGFPVAGALAAAAILLIETVALGPAMPWEWVAERVPESHMAELGTARDQRALARLADGRAEGPLVFAVGSSRAEAGFDPATVPPDERPAATLVELAHPGLRPFEVRSLVDELLPHEPAVVVLLTSEFETAHPIDLGAPLLSSGSFSAIADLAEILGWRRSLELRHEILRFAAVALLRGYRFRGILGSAGLDALREFPLDERLQRPRDRLEWLLAPGERIAIPAALRRRVGAEIDRHLAPESRFAARVEMHQLHSLGTDDSAPLQEELVARSVARLRAAGARVVIVEVPLFPGAAPLYDPALREAFARFAARLAEAEGVDFVPLESGPAFERADFRDLTHLASPGAEKLTRRALRAVERALAETGAGAQAPPPRDR